MARRFLAHRSRLRARHVVQPHYFLRTGSETLSDYSHLDGVRGELVVAIGER
jgi:hypothetical protein